MAKKVSSELNSLRKFILKTKPGVHDLAMSENTTGIPGHQSVSQKSPDQDHHSFIFNILAAQILHISV